MNPGTSFRRQFFSITVLVWAALAWSSPERQLDGRGRQFLGYHNLGAFKAEAGKNSGETIYTSPELAARINFNQVIVSWNAVMPENSYLIAEVRTLYEGTPTKYYTLGVWSEKSPQHPRTSIPNQKDPDGNVSTDTLILERPATHLQLRLTLGFGVGKPRIKFLGIALADTKQAAQPLPAHKAAWGKSLPVPERSQMPYPNGKTLCSPTTVSMLLGYWAQKLQRPELDKSVPEIAEAIYDAEWKGTGNWPFNMAYPGSLPGMRGYVTRLSDVSEIEDWILAGIPVGLSVDYDRLRAKGPGPNGHLVVCVGFTSAGDPVINDPGTSEHVRKTFPRKNLVDAWSASGKTVYLVYPESLAPPEDRFGHWDSPNNEATSHDQR